MCGAVMSMDGDSTLRAEIFSDGALRESDRNRLGARLAHSYGLDEDIAAFTALAERAPAMREPLAALAGMRQSCPENLADAGLDRDSPGPEPGDAQ